MARNPNEFYITYTTPGLYFIHDVIYFVQRLWPRETLCANKGF